jgi:hypothetical protein
MEDGYVHVAIFNCSHYFVLRQQQAPQCCYAGKASVLAYW